MAQSGKLTEERSGELPSVCAQLGIGSPAELAGRLAESDYIASESLATSIFLALALRRPLLLEGEAGVGKTEVGKTLARLLGSPLIRLQCYEGIDASQALYEWNYSGQLLHLRTVELVRQSHGEQLEASIEDELYSDRFLIRRPLLRALDPEGSGDTLPTSGGRPLPAVLLIDELDRADDEFEAFLLEALSDYAATVPELGTIVSKVPPVVIITSNRTRDLHDALKRRCLYHWVGHPDFATEVRIIMTRVPAAVSDPLRRIFSPGFRRRVSRMHSLSRRTSSCAITAEVPSGTGAPVKIRAALPAGGARPAFPAGMHPSTRSRHGPAPASAAASSA